MTEDDPRVLNELQPNLTDLVVRAHKRFLNCSDLTLEEAERLGTIISILARDVAFWLGDLARYTEARWPDTHHQVWPVTQSPGQLSRNAGVCRQYPHEEDRRHEATYSQYMQVAGKPDRKVRLATMEGQTTDESRSTKRTMSGLLSEEQGPRWLLAVDCNYYIHRFWHSGAGVEAASGVASWIERTAKRLAEDKGLTDVVCCFDSPNNHRKQLTDEWEDKYKDRGKKEPELIQQINLAKSLLNQSGFATVSVDGMEADDVMASYAVQFPGQVTLLTQDKDQRQCLSGKCNILLDVEWLLDDVSGDHLPEYKWLSAKKHAEETGIPSEKWTDYQMIMGDNVDGIRGVEGIGAKGAADLVNEFGTVEAVIEAAKAGNESIKPKKRDALIAFEEKLDVTRKLVTLRTDLEIPLHTTRLA